jgi:hypothetical protein
MFLVGNAIEAHAGRPKSFLEDADHPAKCLSKNIARGDSVAIPENKKAAPKGGFSN